MKSEFKEFTYYLGQSLNDTAKRKLTTDQYNELALRGNQIQNLVLRVYFENKYLLVKKHELKEVNPPVGHGTLKLVLVTVVTLILTWWFKWLLIVDLMMVIGYLSYQHYQCVRDASYYSVQILDDHLSNTSFKNRYYQYPLTQFYNYLNLYQALSGARQGIRFDDFILLNNFKIVSEPNFDTLLKVDINLNYSQQMVSIGTLDDYLLKELRILPDRESDQYIHNGSLTEDILSVIQQQPFKNVVSKMIASNNYQSYPEISNLEMKKVHDEMLKEQQDYVDEHGFPEKIWKVWEYFDEHGDDLGFSYWDNNGNSTTGNEDYLSMRMRLIGEHTYADAKKKVDLISKQLRCDVMTKAIANDHGSFQMIFVLGQITSPKTIDVATIKRNAAEGKLVLGNSRTGQYEMVLPRADDLTAIMCGAVSRSGKSTMITQVILSLLYLKTANGYDYSDTFIATVKDEDYIVNGFKQAGMLVKSDVSEIYEMLQYVDEQATKRKDLFIKCGVKNIKEFNQKYPDKYLGKMLVVFDEYANTLVAAESERVEIGGKQVKLRDAIEKIMVKIAQEHGSRGVSIIVITQQFAKGEVGRLFDTTNIQLLGYARSNVWNSIDNTQEMAKYLESKGEDRRGLFFVNAPDCKTTNPQIAFNSGFSEVRTANIETSEVCEHFDRKFNTSKEYSGLGSDVKHTLKADQELLI